MPTLSVFDRINALRQPALINTMIGLTNYRKRAIAGQADAQDEENQSNAKVTTTAEPDGQVFAHVENIPLSSAKTAGEQAIATLDEELTKNTATWKKLNEQANAGPATVSTFARTYGASVAHGGGLIRSAIGAAASPDALSPASEAAAKYYKENVEPLLTTARNEDKEKLSNARLERLLGKDNAGTIKGLPFHTWDASQDLSQGATALGKTVDELTPKEKAGITNAALVQRSTFEKNRATTAATATSKLALPDVAGLSGDEDIKKYVDTVAGTVPGGMTPDERDKLQTRVVGLSKRYKSLDAQERAKLDIEQERVKQIKRNNDLAESAAADAKNPEKMAALVAQIEQDPHAYYTPNIQKDAVMKKAVDNALIAKHGRVPSKPLTDDDKAMPIARAGLNDLDSLDQKAEFWEKKGVPLTGAVVGRLNAKEQSIGSPVTAIAAVRRLVPGFDKLTPAEQNQYIEDAQYYNSRANTLLTREIKNATGGRGGQYFLPIFEQSTPGLTKGGPIRAGASKGLRDEFNNRLTVARSDAWGGVDPLGAQPNAAAPAAGNVISLDDALAKIKKGKK